MPQIYGWKKKREHLSSLVIGGERTREESLAEITTSPSGDFQMKEYLEYILKFLKKRGEDNKS